MRINTILSGIIFAGWILSSCITTQRVPIDQLEPGKVTLPVQIRKVALVSRNFKFSIDTLAGYYNLDFHLKKGSKSDNQVIDSAPKLKWYLIDVNSTFCKVWNFLITILIIYTMFVSPF